MLPALGYSQWVEYNTGSGVAKVGDDRVGMGAEGLEPPTSRM